MGYILMLIIWLDLAVAILNAVTMVYRTQETNGITSQILTTSFSLLILSYFEPVIEA